MAPPGLSKKTTTLNGPEHVQKAPRSQSAYSITSSVRRKTEGVKVRIATLQLSLMGVWHRAQFKIFSRRRGGRDFNEQHARDSLRQEW
jgi:hypothetical protein